MGFLLALLFEKQFPGRRFLLILVLTPMMLSFVAVGAFFRYYYEPTFGLLSQVVRAVHRRAVHPAGDADGRHGRHRLRRCLDVVAVRHAAGAGRPRLGAEIPLRGGRDRPGVLVAHVQHDHLPLHQAACCCWRCCSAPSRRSSCSTWSFLITNGGPGTATETIAVYVYRLAFQYFRTSQSAALAYILLFIVIVLTNLYLYFVNRRAREA